jgi:anti-anti-sigma factor
MIISETIQDTIAILELDGRLDINQIADFENAIKGLAARGNYKIVLDCNKLSFISSAGLRVLIIAQKELEPLSGEICFFGLNSNTRRIFEITGYVNLFHVSENRLDALQYFGAKP